MKTFLKILTNGWERKIKNMILEYHKALSEKDCQLLIETAEPLFERAGTLGENYETFDEETQTMKKYRTAENAFLPRESRISKRIFNFIYDVADCLPSQMENITVIKYNVGGEYKIHHDSFFETEEYYADITANGGNRIKTALIYLNDDFTGGETTFPYLETIIKPEKGKLVIWDNMLEGKIYQEGHHAGLPVKTGIKYIAVIFIREKDFVKL